MLERREERQSPTPCAPRASYQRPTHFAGRGRLERAFPTVPSGVGAAMLAADLKLAGVPYEDESGRVADFRSLRGQAAIHALAAGASPKMAQNLLRHSSPDLTLRLYARVRPGEEHDVIERLPDILPTARERATGTSNATSCRPNRVASSVAFQASNPGQTRAPESAAIHPHALATAQAQGGMVRAR